MNMVNESKFLSACSVTKTFVFTFNNCGELKREKIKPSNIIFTTTGYLAVSFYCVIMYYPPPSFCFNEIEL